MDETYFKSDGPLFPQASPPPPLLFPQIVKEIKVMGPLTSCISYLHALIAGGQGDFYDDGAGIVRINIGPADVAYEPSLKDVRSVTFEYEK